MMDARLSTLSRALLLSCLFGVAFSKDFPSIKELEESSYSTEVQFTLAIEEAAIYVKEYYDSVEDAGSVTIQMEGSFLSVYYDNTTNEVVKVNKTHCVGDIGDITDFEYTPLYHGWLSTDPLVIGPSAPLHFAQKYRNQIVYKGVETVRDIECDKWELPIANEIDQFTIVYHFAPETWTTPYKFQNLRIPIRIRIVGMSSRYTEARNITMDVDQTSDFAFFRPSIEDRNNLVPPIGMGCESRQKAKMLPSVPQTYQFTAEIVNRLQKEAHYDFEIGFEAIWYDYTKFMVRFDQYTKKDGYKSALYDFLGGAAYYIRNDGSCQIDTLRDTEFIKYEGEKMTGSMEEPAEAIFLDGEFYPMGKRVIRGMRCDTFEKLEYNAHFQDQLYHKIVTTAFFTEDFTKVGVNGKMEKHIPVYMMVNGWSSPGNKTLELSGSVFGFNEVIWPEMQENFGLEKCYNKTESKTYFVLVIEGDEEAVALMEGQNAVIMKQLRREVARAARVHELRIPFLKADYKSSGIHIQGVLLERPPAQIQFRRIDSGTMTTKDPDYKPVLEAKTLEDCAYACLDNGNDFFCRGYYFCNQATCFLKSTDPFDDEKGGNETTLGVCEEYMRTESDSLNDFKHEYLNKALENLEIAVLNQSISVMFLNGTDEVVAIVSDIVIGEGPYTGVDAGDKPFTLGIEWRKLDVGLDIVRNMPYADTLTDCYKQCKEAGSACAAFSFCPDLPGDDKQCLITPELIVKGVISDTYLVPDKYCNIYHLKYSKYFDPYPEDVSIIPGDKSIRSITSIEKCAQNCRMEKDFVCRGFEYCPGVKTCNLHKKHILDFKKGEKGVSDKKCIHYAARYIADYMDLGPVLVNDNSNVRYSTSLEECAKICSVELKEKCKSFNYCPSIDFKDSTCALSDKLLRDDDVNGTLQKECLHYEKRDVVHDWDTRKPETKELTTGYTSKGFTGLVIGMLFLGLVIGAVGFVGYSYMRSKSSDDGMAVRFMKT